MKAHGKEDRRLIKLTESDRKMHILVGYRGVVWLYVTSHPLRAVRSGKFFARASDFCQINLKNLAKLRKTGGKDSRLDILIEGEQSVTKR